MDYCQICTDRGYLRQHDRYSICGPCYSGVRSIISLINHYQNNHKSGKSGHGDGGGGNGSGSGGDNKYGNLPAPSQPFANCLRWINELKDVEEEQKDNLAYLGGFVDFFKEQIHTDIQLLPGSDGVSIPAHRALLATRSNIFKNMLSSDGIMAPPSDKIALPEFTYEELDCFLELIYSGQLTKEKLDKHLYALSIASDKYEIPLLAKFCEKRLIKSLNSKNALEVLEMSHTCSMQRSKEFALDFIVKNVGEIVFSPNFDEFVLKNPHLSAEITRASFVDSKRKKVRLVI